MKSQINEEINKAILYGAIVGIAIGAILAGMLLSDVFLKIIIGLFGILLFGVIILLIWMVYDRILGLAGIKIKWIYFCRIYQEEWQRFNQEWSWKAYSIDKEKLMFKLRRAAGR